MPADLASSFVDALHALEAGDGPDALAALYADDAVSGNTASSRRFDGPDGARTFWTAYRDAFDAIRSEFRHVLADDGAVALEWTSTATLAGGDGDEVAYEGVTVLVLDGDRITRSTAYFDPRVLLGPSAPA